MKNLIAEEIKVFKNLKKNEPVKQQKKLLKKLISTS